MKKQLVATVLLFISLPFIFSGTSPKHLCDFVEENDMFIPVGPRIASNGMTEEIFNEIIDGIETNYAPIAREYGGNLSVNRRWTDGTVNASAQRSGSTWIINMYGGLARHETITPDGFALVVCHETGHHLGGAPKISAGWFTWPSNEGQSDYFATLKCLRRYFAKDDNVELLAEMDIPEDVVTNCEAAFAEPEEVAICQRGAMAGNSTALLFQVLRNEATIPLFDTPDSTIVSSTLDSHPATQCRLDTYWQGALCVAEIPGELDDGLNNTNPVPGTCARVEKFESGIRPLCWYKP